MKSRTPFQPISQIKQNVTNKFQKNYCQNYHQKNLTLYQLQQDKIVIIQRWFRAKISQGNRKKEAQILDKVAKREQLLKKNKELLQRFNEAQEKRAMLMRIDQKAYVEQATEAIIERLKKAIEGTLQNAQKLAKNNGKAKHLLSEIKTFRNQGEQLEGQVEGLKFELESFKNRKEEWEQKLSHLKESIIIETMKSHELQQKLQKFKQSEHSLLN